jgi:hypothetical protein
VYGGGRRRIAPQKVKFFAVTQIEGFPSMRQVLKSAQTVKEMEKAEPQEAM